MFDVAGNLLLVDVAEGKELARQNVVIYAEQPQARARLLAEHGATVLICGAISCPQEMALSAMDIEVVSQTCGDVEQVLAAYIRGGWTEDLFLMPGCRGRRRRFRAGRRSGGRCGRYREKGGDDNA